MEKIKSNLKGLIVATAGLLFFAVWMFLPWMSGFNGYDLLDADFLFNWVDAGFLVFIFNLLLLLVALGVMGMSVFMILKGFFGIEVGPINKIIDKFGCWVHLGFGGLTVLVLIAAIIVDIANRSLGLDWGIFVAVLFNAGSWAAVFVLEKMGIIGDDVVAGPKVSYVCSKCGAKAAKGAAFCNQCGGKVEEVVTLPMVYACSQCGAPSKAGVAFCNQCGGKIEGKEVAPKVAAPKVSYACSQCGAPSKEGIAFCNQCGGKITASVPAPAPAPAPAPVPAPAPAPAPANVCSQCGAQLRPGAAFCNQCGNRIG